MATGERGPATGLEPGTYTLSRSFSHEPSIPVASPVAGPFSPVAILLSSGFQESLQQGLNYTSFFMGVVKIVTVHTYELWFVCCHCIL